MLRSHFDRYQTGDHRFKFGMHWLYMPMRERAVLCDPLALSWKRGLVGRHVVLPEVDVICLTIQEFSKV